MTSLDEQRRLHHELLLRALEPGVRRVPELREVGVPRGTFEARLEELVAEGLIELDVGSRGRAGSACLTESGRARVAAMPPLPVSCRVTEGSYLLWFDAPLREQRGTARELRRAGASAVFDCQGTSTLLAVFPDVKTGHTALRSLEEGSDRERGGGVLLVGEAP